MNTKLINRALLAIYTIAMCTVPLAAQSGEQTDSLDADQIMKLSREYQRGLTNSMAEVTMVIESRGNKIVRSMQQYVLESDDAGNRTINVFSEPADVKGVSVLTHTAQDGNDQQWLFLPSINRTKRISSSNRSGSFVGSDFAFEDLSSLELSKYHFNSAVIEEIDGEQLIKVTYDPTYSGSGYSHIETYLRKDNYQPAFNKYYNSRGEHYKTLHLSNYISYKEAGAWRPHLLTMEDHIKSSVTEITVSRFSEESTSKKNFRAKSFNRVR
ncbi:outer membrane lipoprotein-sorting protein [Endozoicomonas ascidiicola]|uniref:outer membrane lipoprotein-sorting protein n=1 Tax=Endozoicomonas ascidiicola TaxID=1698521 RepID=UPI00082A45CF|nr:outer membrane lipoprotein-sorting protein [Endozoicomonas ascidiicola]